MYIYRSLYINTVYKNSVTEIRQFTRVDIGWLLLDLDCSLSV